MDLGAPLHGVLKARADLHPLDRRDGHGHLGQPPVQLPVPVDVAPQARHQAAEAGLEDPPEGVPLGLGLVYAADHLGLGLGVGHAHGARLNAGEEVPGKGHPAPHPRHARHVPHALHPQEGEELHGHRPHGHPHGGFPGAGPLQHVPQVLVPVLEAPGEVGVAGPGGGEGPFAGLVAGGGVHHFHPVPEVGVPYGQGHGGPGGAPGSDPGAELYLVPLNDHAPSPAVAFLPPFQPGVDVLLGEGKPGGQPLNDGQKLGAVGLACGQEPHGPIVGKRPG